MIQDSRGRVVLSHQDVATELKMSEAEAIELISRAVPHPLQIAGHYVLTAESLADGIAQQMTTRVPYGPNASAEDVPSGEEDGDDVITFIASIMTDNERKILTLGVAQGWTRKGRGAKREDWWALAGSSTRGNAWPNLKKYGLLSDDRTKTYASERGVEVAEYLNDLDSADDETPEK